jgi:hypothetical protein
MKNILRYHRFGGLHSASVTLTDEALVATLVPTFEDPDFNQTGTCPRIAGQEIAIEITRDQMLALPVIDDGALLTFCIDEFAAGRGMNWLNAFAATVTGRLGMQTLFQTLGKNAPLRIIVPSRSFTSMRQCAFVFCLHTEGASIDAGEPVTEIPNSGVAAQFAPVISGDDLIGPGETKIFTVQLRAFDGTAIAARSTIYLETTAGVLNRQRVVLDENGQGSFALTAAELAPGETLRIKSGFRYFPGAFEKSVTVE